MSVILNKKPEPIKLDLVTMDEARLDALEEDILAGAPSARLYKCGLDDNAGIVLSNILLANPPLEKLDLGTNQIHRIGAEAIASALPDNTNLRVLSFAHNPIGDEAGAEQAARLHVRRACAAALELLDAEPAPPLSEFSTARRAAAGPIPPAP